MGNCHPEHQLAVGSAQGTGSFKEFLIHIGNAVHGSHGDGKPGAQGNDEHGTAEEAGCHHHHNGDPGGGGDGAQELDNGVDPVAAALGVAAGNAGDQAQDGTAEIAQEQQPQGVHGAFQNHHTVLPEGIQHEVQAGHEGLGQNTGLQSQIIIEGQQQEQGGEQRCLIAELFVRGLIPLHPLVGGIPAPDIVGNHQNNQAGQIHTGIGISSLVGDQGVLSNGNQAAGQGQDHNDQLKESLDRGQFLPFQVLQLLPGQLLRLSDRRGVGFHRTSLLYIFSPRYSLSLAHMEANVK